MPHGIVTLETAPTVEPISVADAKQRLRIAIEDDDTDVLQMIATARKYVEDITDRQLMTATRKFILDEFWCGALEIPRAPLATVVSIQYIDVDGDTQTVDSAVYTVDTDSVPGRIYLAVDQSWPSTQVVRKAVTINYTCGDDEVADVEEGLRQALYLLIGHLYENRESTSIVELKTVPMGFDAMIAPFRNIPL